MITFFDIPSKLPGNAWSPVNWRIRFVLNYKKLSYKTEWIEYPDIEPISKKYGIKPTGTKPDGSPYYTLPAIYDDATGVYLADSIPIAQYLDKTYPETPIIIPAGTEVLMYAFLSSFFSKSFGVFGSIGFLKMAESLHSISAEHFIRTRSAFSGKTLEEMVPTGEARVQVMEDFKKGLEVVKGWYEKNGGKKFVMGDDPTFSDFAVASFFLGVKLTFGDADEDWKAISSWQEGRWVKLLDDLKQYQAVI